MWERWGVETGSSVDMVIECAIRVRERGRMRGSDWERVQAQPSAPSHTIPATYQPAVQTLALLLTPTSISIL